MDYELLRDSIFTALAAFDAIEDEGVTSYTATVASAIAALNQALDMIDDD